MNEQKRKRILVFLIHSRLLPAPTRPILEAGGDDEIRLIFRGQAGDYVVSNCRAERLSVADRFERWSSSTPTTSFVSL